MAHANHIIYGRITFCWVHWLQDIAMVNLFFLDILSPFSAGMIRQCLHSETKQAHDSNVFESLSPPWHTCSCTRAQCFRAFGKYAWCPSQKMPQRMAVTHQPWVLVDHLAAWVATSSLVPQGIVWCNVMYPIANPWQQTNYIWLAMNDEKSIEMYGIGDAARHVWPFKRTGDTT